MSNTQEQDRVLGRLGAHQLSAEELEAVAGGFFAGTGLCSVGPVPNLGITSDGDCDCPTFRQLIEELLEMRSTGPCHGALVVKAAVSPQPLALSETKPALSNQHSAFSKTARQLAKPAISHPQLARQDGAALSYFARDCWAKKMLSQKAFGEDALRAIWMAPTPVKPTAGLLGAPGSTRAKSALRSP